MKKSIKILIPVVILILVVLAIVYGPLLYNPTPHETGWLTYVPIDELPAGNSAVVLTEADFEQHPALSFIFEDENQIQTIALTMDKDATAVPNPAISEKEGYSIFGNYKFVDYNGQLYACDMVMT